jgi:hypothetical protein
VPVQLDSRLRHCTARRAAAATTTGRAPRGSGSRGLTAGEQAARGNQPPVAPHTHLTGHEQLPGDSSQARLCAGAQLLLLRRLRHARRLEQVPLDALGLLLSCELWLLWRGKKVWELRQLTRVGSQFVLCLLCWVVPTALPGVRRPQACARSPTCMRPEAKSRHKRQGTQVTARSHLGYTIVGIRGADCVLAEGLAHGLCQLPLLHVLGAAAAVLLKRHRSRHAGLQAAQQQQHIPSATVPCTPSSVSAAVPGCKACWVLRAQ